MFATDASSPDAPDPGWVAVISTDGDFRSSVQQALSDDALPLQLALAIDCPFSAVGEMERSELERTGPELALVDLESDPERGMAFIEELLESGDVGGVVAAGRDLSHEFLLRALQAGVMEVLAKPLDHMDVREALQRVLRRGGRLPAPRGEEREKERTRRGRILALMGAKGGVGTTALATNLAVEIHRITEERVLLLDLDLEQGETGILLGMEPRFSLLELLRNYDPLVSSLLAACIDHHEASGIDLLAAPLQMAPMEAEDLKLVSGSRMKEVMGFLREHYDYVVVDRPRTFHPAFNQVLEEADERYLVTTPDLQALRNVTRSLPLLQRASGSGENDSVRMVVNRFPPDAPISLDEISRTVGLEVYHSLGADFFPINESIHERTPAVMREASQYSRDVLALAGKITGTQVTKEPRRSLFGGLMDVVRKRS